MEEPIIEVKHLSKQYNIGMDTTYKTLSESFTSAVRQPIKTLKDFRRRNETFWALKDVNFEVNRGEVIGIIGRNGAGKSTLLKILSRITYPTEGEVILNGRVGSLLEVGTGFHPELSGRENVYFNGAILGMKKREIDKKFYEIVEFSGVEKFLDTPVKRYSSGMQVRLAFSVAAHLEPEILVVDEVLAVGDAAFQKKCLGKMSEVAEGGRTVIFVSHNMKAIEQLCNSCAMLDNGKLKLYSKDVNAVINQYMQAMDNSKPICEWINLKNEYENRWFKPEKVTITTIHGEMFNGILKNNDDVLINIYGSIEEWESALQVGYCIYDESGGIVYLSLHTDVENPKYSKLSPGKYHFYSQLPKRLLNEGKYRVELLVLLHYRQWICQNGVNSPSIFFEVRGGLSDSPFWREKRLGAVAPLINWEVDTCPTLHN
jgi:lipopolysaccharide transport system ATP-binding protein